MPLSRCLALCLIASLPAVAQPPGQNRGVTFSHVHLNSAHPDAAIAFWTDIIGASTYSHESLRGVSFQGTLILIGQADAPGPSGGTAIDHVAIKVPDFGPLIAKLAKTPFKRSDEQLMIDGPDGVRIEVSEDNAMYAPLEFDHIHLSSPQPSDSQAWYAKTFGARMIPDDRPNSSRVANTVLVFAKADSASPTTGRAIDHVAFEIRDLEAFCKKLAADGIKFDSPYHAVPDLKISQAFLTDPWGARIELTEGLAH